MNEILVHTYGPRYQLFIIGAGMVSKYLADMAQILDYEVTVCDPREDLLNDFNVDGVRLIREMPDDSFAKCLTTRLDDTRPIRRPRSSR